MRDSNCRRKILRCKNVVKPRVSFPSYKILVISVMSETSSQLGEYWDLWHLLKGPLFKISCHFLWKHQFLMVGWHIWGFVLQVIVLKMCFMKYLMALNALYLFDNELFSIHMQATFWIKKLLFFQHYFLSVLSCKRRCATRNENRWLVLVGVSQHPSWESNCAVN